MQQNNSNLIKNPKHSSESNETRLVNINPATYLVSSNVKVDLSASNNLIKKALKSFRLKKYLSAKNQFIRILSSIHKTY